MANILIRYVEEDEVDELVDELSERWALLGEVVGEGHIV